METGLAPLAGFEHLAQRLEVVADVVYDGAGRVSEVIEYASPLSLTGLPALLTPDDVVPRLLPSEEDRHSRTFYDDDGMLLASLDAAGTLTRYRYGSSGRLDVSITFAVAVDPMLHAGGDLATLVGSISAQTGGDHSGDLYTWYFHNNKGERTGVLDAESYLTEYRYDAAANEIERIRYASRTAPYAGCPDAGAFERAAPGPERERLQLEGFLAARAGGVRRLELRLFHRAARITSIPIGLVAPSRAASHFTQLARERLGATALPEPVRALGLAADEVVPLTGAPLALFDDGNGTNEDWPRLVERLRARLGAASVHGVRVAEEHRPEYATQPCAPAAARDKAPRADASAGRRPLWLLETPRPLAEVGAVPHHGGPLKLVAGPERIESGFFSMIFSKIEFIK